MDDDVYSALRRLLSDLGASSTDPVLVRNAIKHAGGEIVTDRLDVELGLRVEAIRLASRHQIMTGQYVVDVAKKFYDFMRGDA